MKGSERVVYSLTIDDIQTVAKDDLERKLNKKELKMVENKIGDHVNWFEAISSAMKDSNIDA
ncbi:MAG: hypothetical protein HY036_02350 [Nitrospirae bacterium]|nr:hypothetical protein [Nitrospirota bacterium]MBI3351398.1 hypothetical protein [Nitrospirota bacterium]